jgi:hypothetical protein
LPSPAFSAKQNAGGGTAANVTCNVPTNSNGDLLIFFLSKDATGAITDVAGTWNVVANATANTFHMYVAWKIASSEPASYTFNFASTWRDCVMMSFTGNVTAETPLDPDSPTAPNESASATSLATPSNTTTTANTLGVSFHNYINITTWQAEPGGWTPRQNSASNELHVMDQAFATAQTISGVTQAGNGSAGAFKAFLLAIQSEAAAGGGVVVRSYRRMLTGVG